MQARAKARHNAAKIKSEKKLPPKLNKLALPKPRENSKSNS